MSIRRPDPIVGYGFKVRSDVSGESRTKQAFAAESDINRIVKNHTEGARIALNPRQPEFGDFSKAQDLHTAMMAVDEALEAYRMLPADVRTASRNSPKVFLEMLADETQAQHLVDAGLPIEGMKPSPPPSLPSRPASAASPPAERSEDQGAAGAATESGGGAATPS